MKSDGRTISHEVLETYRFAAIKLKKSGVGISVIANSFNVTERAVYRWLKKSKTEGIKSLKSSKAIGPKSYLSDNELSTLINLIRKPATELGYSTDLWSGPRIRHLVKHRFGIEYHVKHMPRLLKWLGLELKFPERRALEQDPRAVREWKQNRFPEIIKHAKKKRALLFYADEAIISLIPYVGKTWALPNKKPIVRVSGKRGQNIGVTAAVNQQGRMCFELTKEKERFTAKVFIRFIKKIHREHPDRCIVLIVDGAPVHTARIVKIFMEESKSWLRLEILPAYSPELNPTEKSWRFLKTKKLNGSTVSSKEDLRNETKIMIRQIKKDKGRVASFFEKK
jgi:transposase